MATEKQQKFLSRTREALCDDFIRGIMNSTHPITKRWKPGEFQAPYNPITGKRYRGVNMMNLAGAGYSDPRWMTYNQSRDNDCQVRKGATSMPIIFWTMKRRIAITDESGKAVLDGEGKKQYTNIELQSPICQVYRVFNAIDIDGMEPLPKPEIDDATQEKLEIGLQEVKNMIGKSGAVILHDQSNRCFYRPSADEIHMAKEKQFDSEAAYVATLFHELGHWTGHATRLNRDILNPFGSKDYAREELRAEFFSFYANVEYGIGFDIQDHQAYLKSWVEILKDEPEELFKAARDADKIAGYIQQITQEVDHNMDNEKTEVEGPVDTAVIPTRQYMSVSYDDKNDFKAACIEHNIRYGWDSEAKAWYIDLTDGANLDALTRWKLQELAHKAPEGASHETIMAEFGTVLREAELVLAGQPVMDGQIHRVPVEGAKPGSRDGAYVGHLDGVPNGWFQNHRQDTTGKWVSSREAGVTITEEHKAEAAQMRIDREREIAERRKIALAELPATLARYGPATDFHPYVYKKQLDIHHERDKEVRVNELGSLVIPLFNIKGELQSALWISEEGKKGVYKDTVPAGTFAVVDDARGITTPGYCNGVEHDVVLIAEGWATAKTISQHTRLPVLFGVNSTNMITVASAWRDKWPNANILICADNDVSQKVNKGRIYGEKAAAKVDGAVIFPRFPKGIRGTDFNDLHVEMHKRNHAGSAVDRMIRDQVHGAITQLKLSDLNKNISVGFGI